MTLIQREPDDIGIICENGFEDEVNVRFEAGDGCMNVYVTSHIAKPCFLFLRWNGKCDPDTKILGDKWERSYGDLCWEALSDSKFHPWYFAANYGGKTVCNGVKTGCNSFVCFQCDGRGVTAWLDLRCGTHGVELKGRELFAASFMGREYTDMTAFEAISTFCKVLCPHPILPNTPIYGGNNWYYAYGKSNREQILSDADLQAELSQGCNTEPFMVIDDGWEQGDCSGPWRPTTIYGDMRSLASEIREKHVKPGIWVRLLRDESLQRIHPEYCIKYNGEPRFLDPTVPEVKNYIRETISVIKSWGFDLLKHDYTTWDIFGSWGFELNGMITNAETLEFKDRTKTNAEIVLDLYRIIRVAAGDMLVIGCNTISHLVAGLAEINRTGDDTSGRDWHRTRHYGVNSLGFRLPQHNAFYVVDADCVGILDNNIDWELNRQWAELLAKSGTAFFISCPKDGMTEEQKTEMKAIYRIAAAGGAKKAFPLDWFADKTPQSWSFDGETCEYNWYGNNYPPLS